MNKEPSDSSSSQARHLTREQCQTVDRYAIEELGIPGAVLMENAGRNAADHIMRWLRTRIGDSSRPARVAIACGKGNNGGDGFVIARHLANRGHEVWVDLVGDPSFLAGDAAVNHAIAAKMGIPIRRLQDDESLSAAAMRWKDCDGIMDAMFGTGFTGQLREPVLSIVSRINAMQGPLVVAIDLPSGFDANTGAAGGTVLQADRTITFLAPKVGFLQRRTNRYLGRVTVADIGAPMELIVRRLGLLDKAEEP